MIDKDKNLNPTGTYELNIKQDLDDQEIYGNFGRIQIEKLPQNKIVMTFMVNKGAPSYNSGSFIDTLDYSNNRTIYKTDLDLSCEITFDFSNKGVKVFEKADDYNSGCGFGHGVFVNDFFEKISSEKPELRDPLTNKKIKK
ncbi:hypothetical protein [Mangrovimonas xylaniphaga]|uniref:hypothetical protein n=1 Tax=Mangrovimonas xylaniphaga TaxID=1645915 RepID=UPI0012FAD82A|nr:hypothetical protein [Mangrovimonas xylaniphaga]